LLTNLFYIQYFVVLERLVATGDDSFAWLQTFEHLVVLRVLAAYTNLAAIGLTTIGREDEDPLPARGLEEGAARDEHGLLGLAQFEVDIVGLTCALSP